MIPADRLQELIQSKDAEKALEWCNEHGYSEGWSIIDGALVVYNLDNAPAWLPQDEDRDEDGNAPEVVGYVKHDEATGDLILSPSKIVVQ